MKVVLLAPTPPPAGGIAGWTIRMQNAKLKNNWQVIVVDEKLQGKREVYGKNMKKNMLVELKRCFSIWKRLWITLEDPDVKVVQSCIPATITAMIREIGCAVISKIKHKKFIIHYRCTLPNLIKTSLGIKVFKIFTWLSDYVMVLNSPSLRFLEKNSKTKGKIIPNFIESNLILEENFKILKEKVEVILYVGGVVETKGCLDILEVAKYFPEIEFRLIGGISPKILEKKIEENIKLCGEKTKLELDLEYKNADLFIFPSYFEAEGFSNALAEAMANGLPCIVTDWAANKDMIENKGGIVVNIKNRLQMIEAIKALIYDKELRKNQSNWNIKKVQENYTDKIITGSYVDVYEELLRN